MNSRMHKGKQIRVDMFDQQMVMEDDKGRLTIRSSDKEFDWSITFRVNTPKAILHVKLAYLKISKPREEKV